MRFTPTQVRDRINEAVAKEAAKGAEDAARAKMTGCAFGAFGMFVVIVIAYGLHKFFMLIM